MERAHERAGRCRSSAGFGRRHRLVGWRGVGWCVGDAKPTARAVDVDGRRGRARIRGGSVVLWSDSNVRYIGFVTFVEGSNALFTMKAYPGQYETVHA